MNRTLVSLLAATALAASACVLRPSDQMRFCNQAGPISAAVGRVVDRAQTGQLTAGDARASVTGIREALNEVGPLLVALRAEGHERTLAALDSVAKAAEALPDTAGPQLVGESLRGPLSELKIRFDAVAAATCASR